jgi:hypothetical protein
MRCAEPLLKTFERSSDEPWTQGFVRLVYLVMAVPGKDSFFFFLV